MTRLSSLRTNAGNTGKGFESELELRFRLLEAQNVATLRKVDPPTRILGGGRKIIHLPNPFLDFVGVWTARNGRALFVEGKSTSSGRLPVRRSGGVSESQFESAGRWARAGAAVAILWQYRGEIRVVPFFVLYNVVKADLVSVEWEAAFPIPAGENFLQVLERLT